MLLMRKKFIIVSLKYALIGPLLGAFFASLFLIAISANQHDIESFNGFIKGINFIFFCAIIGAYPLGLPSAILTGIYAAYCGANHLRIYLPLYYAIGPVTSLLRILAHSIHALDLPMICMLIFANLAAAWIMLLHVRPGILTTKPESSSS